LAVKMNLTAPDDLYALIGYGELTAEGVLHRLRDDTPRRSMDELRVSSGAIPEQGRLPIQVPASGIDGILFNLSKCCQPIPGDAIIGYVTRGKGVTIHRIDCPNLRQYRENPEEAQRLLTLDWEESNSGTYQAELEIVGLDRIGLAADIYAIFSEAKTNIRSARMTTDSKHRTMHFVLQVETTGLSYLQEIVSRVGKLSDVLQVHRRHTG
ncbi:MAG: ACT domain-containing protein, partial [bacterium]